MKRANFGEYVAGYEISQSPDGSSAVEGSAFLNGERYIHSLSLDNAVGKLFDLGRSGDGELIWVSDVSTAPSLSLDTRFDSVFTPPAQFTTPATMADSNQSQDSDLDEVGPLHSVLNVLRHHKRKAIMALIAGVAGLALFLMVSSPGQETTRTEQLVTPNTTQQLDGDGMTAEEAAINFVYTGEANIPQLPSGLAREELTAVVVSSSGELVLVEVAQQNSSTYTKFATLLLQKTEATWRIREVFDTQEY